MSTSAPSAPRSIADVIRGLDPDALTGLLKYRPDLAQPRPGTLAELTERAATSASTRVALDQLDAWQLRVAEALAACPDPVPLRRLAALLQAGRGEVGAAVDALQTRALVWGDEGSLRTTQAVRGVFGSHPAGLALPSPVPLGDAEIDALLRQCGPQERALLDELTWHRPTGRVRGAQRHHTLDSASTPAERLLALRLLRALDEEQVIVPREVSLRLREGRLFADQVPSRVPGWPAPAPSRVAEATALGSAVEGLQTLVELVEEVARLEPRPLATGAFARRDLTLLAQNVAPDTPVGFWLELALDLGLLARTATAWLPTTRFDQWVELAAVERWRSMVAAWIDLPGWPLSSLNGIGREDRPEPPGVRRAAIGELRQAVAGTAVTAARLTERLVWRHPRWSPGEVATGAEQTLREAALLGLVSMGVRTQLWDPDHAPAFPEPSDVVLVQSDLTAVAPGPLSVEVRRMLDLVADRESAGPASVHRFSGESVRRALDAGWAGADLVTWLAEHSSTPLPQPLRYLVEDAARRHGRIRVSAVGALLTIEDEAALLALLAHPQAASLGLRRVGPTVVTARVEAAEVVDVLRELGQSPVAEDEHGELVTAPVGRRARPVPRPGRPAAPSTDRLRALATELIERGEASAPATDFDQLLATLNQAQASGDWLRLTHVDDQGRQRTVQVRVMAVVAGQARLVAKGAGQFIMPISRVVRAVALD